MSLEIESISPSTCPLFITQNKGRRREIHCSQLFETISAQRTRTTLIPPSPDSPLRLPALAAPPAWEQPSVTAKLSAPRKQAVTSLDSARYREVLP